MNHLVVMFLCESEWVMGYVNSSPISSVGFVNGSGIVCDHTSKVLVSYREESITGQFV
jgi:hypothetical protein